MRYLKLASTLMAAGTLVLACTTSSDDGELVEVPGGANGMGTGGTGTAGAAPVTTGGMGGMAAIQPFGYCADDEAGTAVAQGTCNLINDFEDGLFPSFSVEADGKEGAGVIVDLSLGKDGTGTGSLESVGDGANGSSGAIRIAFAGAEDFGGALRYQLSASACYDASAYEGVTFYAKAASAKKKILVMGGVVDNYPELDCPQQADEEGKCFDYPRATITLTESWAKYTVTWDELLPPSWGQGTAFDPTRLVDLWFADAGTEATNEIEFFLDELAFVGGNASMCVDDTGMGGMGGGG